MYTRMFQHEIFNLIAQLHLKTNYDFYNKKAYVTLLETASFIESMDDGETVYLVFRKYKPCYAASNVDYIFRHMVRGEKVDYLFRVRMVEGWFYVDFIDDEGWHNAPVYDEVNEQWTFEKECE